MHTQTLNSWRHEHVFLGPRHDENERRSWFVVGLTTRWWSRSSVG